MGRRRRHSHLTIIDKSYHSIRNSLFVVVGMNQKKKIEMKIVFFLFMFCFAVIGSCFVSWQKPQKPNLIISERIL